ncbi:MAG: hypothetical protein WBI20_02600 [Burkholderiaceae bacterium]
MANTILHKRSSTAGTVPTAAQVTLGELVMNVADGKIYLKRTDGVIVTFVPGYVPGQGDSAPMWK